MDRLYKEIPIPDWAPFGAPTEEHWRAVQRRRNLVQMVRQIASLAKDEGFVETAMSLTETASQIRSRLISPPGPVERPPSAEPPARPKRKAKS